MPESYIKEKDGKHIRDADRQKQLLTQRYRDVVCGSRAVLFVDTAVLCPEMTFL
jgi:hypothetical protein